MFDFWKMELAREVSNKNNKILSSSQTEGTVGAWTSWYF